MRQIVLLALALVVLGPDARVVEAQGPQQLPPTFRQRGEQLPPGQPFVDLGLGQNAHNTRSELQNLLWQLPPSVRTVLQNDPSLIEQADYLAPYPALQAFLKQHPEIGRNPTFFFGRPEDFNRSNEPLDLFAAVLAGTGLFLGFLTLVTVFASVARQVVDYRRWVRQTRMQTEVHTKILDRMQSNEDLEFTPANQAPQPGAPVSRILWSVQAGVVLAALGIGFAFARNNVPEEVVPAFTVLGIIVMALGVGAVVSAVVAYMLTARLGLLPSPRQENNA